MLQRFSTIIATVAALSGLVWWAGHVESSPPSASEDTLSTASSEGKQNLVEALDQLVLAQHQYRNAHGKFTRLLNRLEYTIPAELLHDYGFAVQEASADRLILVAFTEQAGKSSDFVTIDEEFQLRANFPLPGPRVEYLRKHALAHLNLLRRLPRGQSALERGAFHGFFRYEFQESDSVSPSLVAIGIKSPVAGIELRVPVERSLASNADSLVNEALLKLPGVGRVTGENPAHANELVVEPIRANER